MVASDKKRKAISPREFEEQVRRIVREELAAAGVLYFESGGLQKLGKIVYTQLEEDVLQSV